MTKPPTKTTPAPIPTAPLPDKKVVISYDELIAGKVVVENTLGQQYYIAPTMTGSFILRVMPA
jgi:hypothetical protein